MKEMSAGGVQCRAGRLWKWKQACGRQTLHLGPQGTQVLGAQNMSQGMLTEPLPAQDGMGKMRHRVEQSH